MWKSVLRCGGGRRRCGGGGKCWGGVRKCVGVWGR